jgi:hypothetical protein
MMRTEGTSINPHEKLARERKVNALIERIDDVAAFSGVDPRLDGFAIADMLEGWNDQNWVALADQATVKPPGAETKAAVIAAYRARGVRAQQRAAS